MKDEAIVNHFENNNEEYVTTRWTVTENVRAILSNGEILLRSALDILIGSIEDSPDKYSSLVYENMSSMTTYTTPSFGFYPYSQQQSQHNYYDTKEMLIENSAKLYNILAENLVDKILSDYAVQTSQPSLPLLPS